MESPQLQREGENDRSHDQNLKSKARTSPECTVPGVIARAQRRARTFHRQHRGDDEAAHPQQVIHCHKPGVCNMKEGLERGSVGGWRLRHGAPQPSFVSLSSWSRGALSTPKFSFKKKRRRRREKDFFFADGFRRVLLFRGSGAKAALLSVSFSLCHFSDTRARSKGASPGCCPARADGRNPGLERVLRARGPSAIRRARSCCSSVRDVRRNGNTRTEEGRAGGVGVGSGAGGGVQNEGK